MAKTPALCVPAEQPKQVDPGHPSRLRNVRHGAAMSAAEVCASDQSFSVLIGMTVTVNVNGPDVVTVLCEKVHQRVVTNLQVKERGGRTARRRGRVAHFFPCGRRLPPDLH